MKVCVVLRWFLKEVKLCLRILKLTYFRKHEHLCWAVLIIKLYSRPHKYNRPTHNRLKKLFYFTRAGAFVEKTFRLIQLYARKSYNRGLPPPYSFLRHSTPWCTKKSKSQLSSSTKSPKYQSNPPLSVKFNPAQCVGRSLWQKRMKYLKGPSCNTLDERLIGPSRGRNGLKLFLVQNLYTISGLTIGCKE